jgi:hypothetical protein
MNPHVKESVGSVPPTFGLFGVALRGGIGIRIESSGSPRRRSVLSFKTDDISFISLNYNKKIFFKLIYTFNIKE